MILNFTITKGVYVGDKTWENKVKEAVASGREVEIRIDDNVSILILGHLASLDICGTRSAPVNLP